MRTIVGVSQKPKEILIMAFFFKPKPPVCSVVIAAAGSSQRMDGDDKQFVEIHGKPVLAHTLTVFEKSALVNEIIVVVREDMLTRACEICEQYNITKAVQIISGGETRLDSVMNGVFAVSKRAKLIAIHDGARPCVTDEIIEQAAKTAKKFHAAAPAVPVSSTVKRAERGIVKETVDRKNLFEIQTPQVFTAELIKGALTNAKNKSFEITDDCMAVELIGGTVHLTKGLRSNIKITTSEDILVAGALLEGETV